MYSLIEHAAIGVIFLGVAHWLLNAFRIRHFSRQMIEILIWASIILFVASGLWMPLV